ncbi:hypothetical protein EYF80_039855 [Liparis tanakae]|uniref:Uncharacterized protein n=1 Tax=Liparis tanakae TaxID=230148 RepID=A0A4Z2G8V4_9TELE|nr:hypothetical protein EYF80_039855 [Liparis tanakae]
MHHLLTTEGLSEPLAEDADGYRGFRSDQRGAPVTSTSPDNAEQRLNKKAGVLLLRDHRPTEQRVHTRGPLGLALAGLPRDNAHTRTQKNTEIQEEDSRKLGLVRGHVVEAGRDFYL